MAAETLQDMQKFVKRFEQLANKSKRPDEWKYWDDARKKYEEKIKEYMKGAKACGERLSRYGEEKGKTE